MSLKRTYKRLSSALLSNSKSAYFGLYCAVLSPFGRAFDKLFLKQKTKQYIDAPVICILSAPRSGSTVLFQSLATLIPSVYVSNLHQIIPSKSSSILSKRLKFGKNLLNYRNYYGYTFGWNGVNEGNYFFDSIFKSNDTKNIEKEFRAFLSKIQTTKNEPIIFKNIKHSFEIEKLTEVYPQLKIVRLKRNNFDVSQSILKAYKELNYFNPIPEELKHINFHSNPHEFAVQQLRCIEEKIDSICENLETKNIAHVEYDDFCLAPKKETKRILDDLGLGHLELRNTEIQLNVSKKLKVSKDDEQKLRTYLNKFD